MKMTHADNFGRITDSDNYDEDFSHVKKIAYPEVSDTPQSYTMLIGVPGCGKSTFAATLDPQTVFSTDSRLLEIAERDFGIVGDYNAAFKVVSENKINWTGQLIEDSIKALDHNSEVVLDATNMSKKNRISIGNRARKKGAAIRYIMFWRDLNACRKPRADNKFIGDFVYKRMINSFCYPKIDEYDSLKHIVIGA